MERGDGAIRLRNKFTFFYEIVTKVCHGIEKKEDKISYLKKIIKDCDKIVELSELFDEIEINLESIKKEFVGIDENFYWLLDDEQAGPPLTNICLVNEPQATYMSFELDKMYKNNPNFKIEGIKKIKMHLEFDSEKLISNNEGSKTWMEEGTIKEGFEKIKIKSRLFDVVRIFEIMKKAEIISYKTTVMQIASLFHSNDEDMRTFEKKYNAAKSKMANYNHASNSKELVNFIKYLSEESFRNKEIKLDEIIQHLERLQKFAI